MSTPTTADSPVPADTLPAVAPALPVVVEIAPGDRAGETADAPAPRELGDLPTRLEALLITSGRAVPVVRLAVALGLAPPETPAAPAAPAEAPASAPLPAEGEPPAAVPFAPKKRRTSKKAAGETPAQTLARAAAALNEVYATTARSFRIEQVAGGYRLMTMPEFAPLLAAFTGLSAQSKVSKAGIETLAIIAYKQPVTRAQLEAIRGVACGEILRTLLERRLITIAGRAEELGRPILYATSKGFLEAFGLSSIKDLPSVAEMGLKNT